MAVDELRLCCVLEEFSQQQPTFRYWTVGDARGVGADEQQLSL